MHKTSLFIPAGRCHKLNVNTVVALSLRLCLVCTWAEIDISELRFF